MKNRPVIYSAACLLSFVGSSLAVIVFFAIALFFDFFSEKIVSVTNMNSMQGTSSWYFTMLGILSTFSLVGVIKLWKYRSVGFYYYLFAQFGIAILPVIVLDFEAFSTTNAIFTVLFATIYFFYFRWINRLKKGTTIKLINHTD